MRNLASHWLRWEVLLAGDTLPAMEKPVKVETL